MWGRIHWFACRPRLRSRCLGAADGALDTATCGRSAPRAYGAVPVMTPSPAYGDSWERAWSGWDDGFIDESATAVTMQVKAERPAEDEELSSVFVSHQVWT